MRRGFFGLIVLGLVAISTVVWAAPIVVTPGGNAGYMYFPAPLSQTITVNTGGSSSYMDYTITSSQTFTPPQGTYAIQYVLVGGGSGGWAGQVVVGTLQYSSANGSLVINVGGPGGNTTISYNGTTYTATAGGGTTEVGQYLMTYRDGYPFYLYVYVGGAGYGGTPGNLTYNTTGATSLGAFDGYGGIGWGITNPSGYESYPHGAMRTDLLIPSSIPSGHSVDYNSNHLGTTPGGWGSGGWYYCCCGLSYCTGDSPRQGVVILRCSTNN